MNKIIKVRMKNGKSYRVLVKSKNIDLIVKDLLPDNSVHTKVSILKIAPEKYHFENNEIKEVAIIGNEISSIEFSD